MAIALFEAPFLAAVVVYTVLAKYCACCAPIEKWHQRGMRCGSSTKVEHNSLLANVVVVKSLTVPA